MRPADGFGVDAIWGESSDHSYVYHVVSPDDLLDLSTLASHVASREDKREVRGTLHIAGDDRFDLVVNGRPMLTGGDKGTAVPTVFRPGDVIAIKLHNDRYDRAFMMAFVTPTGPTALRTDREKWRVYSPADVQRWWVVTPSPDHPKPSAVSKRLLKGAEGNGVEAIWGNAPVDSYVYRVVSGDDLKVRQK